MRRWRWPPPEQVDDRTALGVAALLVVTVATIPLVGLLWRWGVPRGVVRGVGLLPDVVLALLVVRGGLRAWRTHQRPDLLDLVVGGFLAVVAVLLVVGLVADPWGGAVAPSLQLLAARAMTWGLLLLLALRTIDTTPEARERLVRVLLVLSVVVAAVGVFEAVFPDRWEWIGHRLLGMHDVQREVYGVQVPETLVVRTPVAGRSLVRAGSLLFEYLQLGFWLLPGLGMAIARVARRPSPPRLALLVLLAAGIVASLGRASLACAAAAFVVVLATRPEVRERRRLALVGGLGVVVLTVLAVPTGVLLRLAATLRGAEASTDIHRSATAEAWEAVIARPWGGGLGTGFATSAREGAPARIAENAYLDVALQGGVVTGVAFVVVVGVLWWALWRRRPWDDLAVGAVAGMVGLSLGGLVLHTWQMLETSWVVLALTGLAVPRPR